MSKENLTHIQTKIENAERLIKEDAMTLMDSNDILQLGRLANRAKERKTGQHVFFNVNQHINLTNICVSRCKFCAFSRDKNDADAYAMTLDEVLEKARSARHLGITEFHIVSGLHPDLPFDYYLDAISSLRQEMPEVHIQAFTAVEIDYFAKIAKLSKRDVLLKLKDAGLGSLPGGGAEILNHRVREAVCPKKANSNEWLEVMKTAHRLGLKSNATMLFGHIESPEERIEHLLTLRALQDETGGFQSFIPLPFHPQNTELPELKKPTAFESLKMLAISRLVLDNFDHIKAFWIMLGLKVAQLSLLFGVDDLDGTVVEEKITHAAGAETDQSISREELLSLIAEAGRIPVERDTLYNIIRVYNNGGQEVPVET
ncbi:MAG: aminofutalosine synthase MqnE [Thermodesulfovibrionales bacterium]|nr:aminofutalosine synthase MqnE [Thermodesulfovibrionales bacterium]